MTNEERKLGRIILGRVISKDIKGEENNRTLGVYIIGCKCLELLDIVEKTAIL